MTEITAHHGLLRDLKLHVDDSGGCGRPVVLIHGWLLSGEAWKHQVGPFQDAGYRVITYDRRGFGRSDKPLTGYNYDTFAEDLHALLEALKLTDVTLIGFSMGGGEVARYIGRYGTDRLHSVVFASAVTPFLAHIPGNPDGPLDLADAAKMSAALTDDEDAFYEDFGTQFFSVGDDLKVSEEERQAATALARQSSRNAALKSMTAFGTTDFRHDLTKVDVPSLIIHSDSDEIVPFEGSGRRTHAAISSSEVHLIAGAPHGTNISDAEEFNRIVLAFLAR